MHIYISQMHTSTNLQFMLPVVAVAILPGFGEHMTLFVIGVKSNMCCPMPAHSVKLTAPWVSGSEGGVVEISTPGLIVPRVIKYTGISNISLLVYGLGCIQAVDKNNVLQKKTYSKVVSSSWLLFTFWLFMNVYSCTTHFDVNFPQLSPWNIFSISLLSTVCKPPNDCQTAVFLGNKYSSDITKSIEFM